MTDRNGHEITIGDHVLFKMTGDRWPVAGIARKFMGETVRCDDGDPGNANLMTNGFHCSAWVASEDVEVLVGWAAAGFPRRSTP